MKLKLSQLRQLVRANLNEMKLSISAPAYGNFGADLDHSSEGREFSFMSFNDASQFVDMLSTFPDLQDYIDVAPIHDKFGNFVIPLLPQYESHASYLQTLVKRFNGALE